MNNFKHQIYTIFENPKQHKYGVFVQSLIFINILVSIFVMFIETEKGLIEYSYLFNYVNTICIFIFTFEYLLRMYSYQKNKIKYFFSPMMIIDLIVLIPFYVSLFNIDLAFLRTLRVLRIFKLFRLAKFVKFDNLVLSILKEKKEEFLYVVISLLILLFTLTPLVYYFENQAQPAVFDSMSATLWWSVTTLTTVGYGDMYPITTGGRFITSIVSFLGIAFYAIPGGIFTSALLEKIKHKKNNRYDKHDSQ